MAKPVRLAREAREEVIEAARRYGEERPELRVEFLGGVDEVLERSFVLHLIWGRLRGSIQRWA